MILNQRIERRFARSASYRQNRNLSLKRHKTFQKQRRVGKFFLHELHIFRRPQNPLPFSVVSHPPRLQYCGQSDPLHRCVYLFRGVHFRNRSSCDPQFPEEIFFVQTVLRRFQSFRRRIHRRVPGKKSHRFHGHIFKFVSYELQPVREFFQGFAIRILCGHAVCNSSHRSLRRGIEKTEVQSQRIARQRQHITKLSAAENANRHAPTSPTTQVVIPRFAYFAERGICFFLLLPATQNFIAASSTSLNRRAPQPWDRAWPKPSAFDSIETFGPPRESPNVSRPKLQPPTAPR